MDTFNRWECIKGSDLQFCLNKRKGTCFLYLQTFVYTGTWFIAFLWNGNVYRILSVILALDVSRMHHLSIGVMNMQGSLPPCFNRWWWMTVVYTLWLCWCALEVLFDASFMRISLCPQLSHCDEQLQLEDKTGLTPLHSITDGMKDAGQRLLNHYVHTQGAAISQVKLGDLWYKACFLRLHWGSCYDNSESCMHLLLLFFILISQV